MAQNITLMGASYSAVPAVTLPKTGGGTASFTDVTDTTAAAADVASGKYFYTAAGVRTQGTNSGGGGGASNIVQGTFKGTTTGSALDITLNYSGSGYPVIIVIYPKEGAYKQGGTFYNLIKRYVTQIFVSVKAEADTTPTYANADTETNNQATIINRYKNSTSIATNYSSSTRPNEGFYNGDSASSTVSAVVRLISNTKMSVYIANTSYGFAANIEYAYTVVYSS